MIGELNIVWGQGPTEGTVPYFTVFVPGIPIPVFVFVRRDTDLEVANSIWETTQGAVSTP